ncbi:hypothetical protein [Streptomyces sp. NPDC018833]|uniref:hypothetical protein n=1 Tax=Streptomyces sp. NPDC018833 TaxID=3365053 RepID=UPI0037B54E01
MNDPSVYGIAAMALCVMAALAISARVLRHWEQTPATARDQRFMEARRAAYKTMNRETRAFHTALKEYLHKGVFALGSDDSWQLGQHRNAHRAGYADAQMVASEPVLQASRDLNRFLAHAYGAICRLEKGEAREDENAGTALALLRQSEPKLEALSSRMRKDLGLDS